jgi:hypothetical protein
MPTYRHPATLEGVAGQPPARVGRAREGYTVDADGRLECPERVAQRLAAGYDVSLSALRVAESDESGASDGSGPDAGETSDGDGDAYECGATLASGGTCSRAVDSPDATCYQH